MRKWIQNRANRFHRPWYSMRKFYNRLQHVYGLVEWHLGPKLDSVCIHLFDRDDAVASIQAHHSCDETALEYACGSGLLTLKLAPHFQQIIARDLSPGMLARAHKRAQKQGIVNVQYIPGNLLELNDSEQSVDRIYLSFALHLFSYSDQMQMLQKLCRIARIEVVIIDHSPHWEPLVALVEWWEGSHYHDFITQDYQAMAQELGCELIKNEVADCLILRFQTSTLPQN